MCFFFKDTATTEIYALSLHDALPICLSANHAACLGCAGKRPLDRGDQDVLVVFPNECACSQALGIARGEADTEVLLVRSEAQTSELQSRQYLVCRLLLEKKTHLPGVL